MFNPANDLRWTGGITSSTPSQPGEMAEGGSVERTARFLGRTFTYGYIVTKKEPDRLVEMSVARPFPMLVRYELDDATDGTLVAILAQGTPGRFFAIAAPLLNGQVGKRITADLQRLRDHLER